MPTTPTLPRKRLSSTEAPEQQRKSASRSLRAQAAPRPGQDLSPERLRPMEARVASELPKDAGDWQYEPKWDGFRCLGFREGAHIELRAKSGKSLARYFPEIVQALGETAAEQFVVDGELLIPAGGNLSFEAFRCDFIRRKAASTNYRATHRHSSCCSTS